MLTGPVDVTNKLLANAKMSLTDIDLIEVNELLPQLYCDSYKPLTWTKTKSMSMAVRLQWDTLWVLLVQ